MKPNLVYFRFKNNTLCINSQASLMVNFNINNSKIISFFIKQARGGDLLVWQDFCIKIHL